MFYCIMSVVIATAAMDEPSLEARSQAILSEYQAIKKILKEIKDRSTAEQAMQQLQYITEWPKLKGLIGEVRTQKQMKWLATEFQAKIQNEKNEIYAIAETAFRRDSKIYDIVKESPFGLMLIRSQMEEVRAHARTIETAIMTYYVRTGGTEWPASLEELVKPKDGGKPYLDGGLKAIVNPWGEPYEFRIVKDPRSKQEQVNVFTVYPHTWNRTEIRSR
jgi:hypothetical protein